MIKQIKSIFSISIIFLTSFFINTTTALATQTGGCKEIFSGKTEEFLNKYYPFITYGLIIALIVYSSIDAIKALVNADDKGSKGFYKRIAKRIAVVCFALLTPSFIKFFFNALGLNYCFFN